MGRDARDGTGRERVSGGEGNRRGNAGKEATGESGGG